MTSNMFGQTETEEELEHILQCREIVKRIMDFGMTQRQLLMLIQFLGSELENHEQMVEMVSLSREFLRQGQALLVDKASEDNNGPTNR